MKNLTSFRPMPRSSGKSRSLDAGRPQTSRDITEHLFVIGSCGPFHVNTRSLNAGFFYQALEIKLKEIC
jgi:hypothetical protein